MMKHEEFERRVRQAAWELREPAASGHGLLQQILDARESGQRYDLLADTARRHYATRYLAPAVFLIAAAAYIAVHEGSTSSDGGECMMAPEIRSIIGAGLFVATACAQDAPLLPVEPPVTAEQLDAASIEAGTWIYEVGHIEDGLHRSVSFDMKLTLERSQDEDEWLLVTTMSYRRGSRTDTSAFDGATFQPRWQRSHAVAPNVAPLLMDRRWESGRLIGERRLASGEYGEVDIELPGGTTTLGGLNHLLIWFQAVPLERQWSGSINIVNWWGNPAIVPLDFRVIGETHLRGTDREADVWVLSYAGANDSGRCFIEKGTGRLLRFELPQNEALTNEIALKGWTGFTH